MPGLHVSLLVPLEMYDGEQPVHKLLTPHSPSPLACLLLHKDQRHRRGPPACLPWPDGSAHAARTRVVPRFASFHLWQGGD